MYKYDSPVLTKILFYEGLDCKDFQKEKGYCDNNCIYLFIYLFLTIFNTDKINYVSSWVLFCIRFLIRPLAEARRYYHTLLYEL